MCKWTTGSNKNQININSESENSDRESSGLTENDTKGMYIL